jgi:hypothetical protein
MAASTSLCRFFAVATCFSFPVILVATVPHAGAHDITYTLVDYPVNETDVVNSGTDAISGTIITDGTLGPWTDDPASHIVGGTLIFSSPVGTFSAPAAICNCKNQDGAFYATPTELLFQPQNGDEVSFGDPTDSPSIPYIVLNYEVGKGGDKYDGEVDMIDPTTLQLDILAEFNAGGGDPSFGSQGSIGANDPWIIADGGTPTPTPEPSTLALLGVGVIGLLGYAWRRRRAKA